MKVFLSTILVCLYAGLSMAQSTAVPWVSVYAKNAFELNSFGCILKTKTGKVEVFTIKGDLSITAGDYVFDRIQNNPEKDVEIYESKIAGRLTLTGRRAGAMRVDVFGINAACVDGKTTVVESVEK